MPNEIIKDVERRVRDHFHADADRFDSIYRTKKGAVSKFIDNYWRGVVQKRLEINIQKLRPLKHKRILDVGCGSGRFCHAFAKEGAGYLLGVDFAPAMIEIATRVAKELGVDDRCEFRIGAFPEVVRESDLPFDASTANGFFDYVAEPVPIITTMREMTRGKMIMSFPKAIEWRVPVRRARFWLKGTPLFLYSAKDVREILGAARLTDYEWITLDRDYLIIAKV
jgi:2-polyprenyl-3-methyl-5-hydroxy-6-metoxy-1,4-benzoquinol methylase